VKAIRNSNDGASSAAAGSQRARARRPGTIVGAAMLSSGERSSMDSWAMDGLRSDGEDG
jgi:hypothetical protein